MKLTPEQLAQFEREGYLFFPAMFSPAEMKPLLDSVPEIYREHRPEVIREKDGKTPRTSFAAHTYVEPFAKLGRHPCHDRARLPAQLETVHEDAAHLKRFDRQPEGAAEAALQPACLLEGDQQPVGRRLRVPAAADKLCQRHLWSTTLEEIQQPQGPEHRPHKRPPRLHVC